MSVGEGRPQACSDTCLPAAASNATADASVLPVTGPGDEVGGS